MKIITIVSTILAVSALLFTACDTVTVEEQKSQVEWTEEGWNNWSAGDYESAEECFNNALEVDNSYPDAYNGLGWTYIRMQLFSTAIDNFNTVKMLVIIDPDNPEYDEDMVKFAYESYAGSAISFFMNDDFENSIAIANYLIEVTNNDFEFSRDTSITEFDIHLLLALNYVETVDMPNCVKEINAMRVNIGEQGNFNSDDWDEINQEIKRLMELDPSPSP